MEYIALDLVPLQRALMRRMLNSPSTGIVGLPYAVALDGVIDVARVEMAFSCAVSRHPILFSRIDFASGSVLHYSERDECAMPFVTVTDLVDRSRSALIMRATELAMAPFTLDSALARGFVVQGDSSTVLGFALHALVADGPSAPILMRDWAACIAGREVSSTAQTGPVSPLEVAGGWLRAEDLADQVGDASDTPDLQVDAPTTHRRTEFKELAITRMPEGSVTSSGRRATTFCCVLAALAFALRGGSLPGSGIDVPHDLRSDARYSSTIGVFVDMLAFVPPADMSLDDLLDFATEWTISILDPDEATPFRSSTVNAAYLNLVHHVPTDLADMGYIEEVVVVEDVHGYGLRVLADIYASSCTVRFIATETVRDGGADLPTVLNHFAEALQYFMGDDLQIDAR